MALILRRRLYARQVISKFAGTYFNCCNSPYTICLTSFSLCAAIWLIYEDTTKNTFVKNFWVRLVENVEILIFALVSVASSIETVVEKRNDDDHVNAIRSIERQFIRPSEEPSKDGCRPLFSVFYAALVALTAYQVLCDRDNLNYQRSVLIAIGQFYLLHCVLRFVSLILNVKRDFAHLNEKLKEKFYGNKTGELGCFTFLNTGGAYVVSRYALKRKSLCEVVTMYADVTDFYECKLQSVHDFSNLHWSICKYVHAANNLYGLRLLACIVCLFYELMFTPYLLSLNLINVRSKTSRKALTYACSLIFHLAELLLLTLSADSATKEVSRLFSIKLYWKNIITQHWRAVNKYVLSTGCQTLPSSEVQNGCICTAPKVR
jgi:hypothetical protein